VRLHLLALTDSKHQITKHIIKSSTNHSRVQLTINSESHKFNKSLKDLPRQRLDKPISNHLLTGHKVYLNLVALMQVMNVVIEDINVL